MSSPKRKFLIGLGVIGLLAVLAFMFFGSSKSTFEQHRANLRAMGEKPTYAELFPHPQPDDEQYKRFTNAVAAIQPHISPESWRYMHQVAPGQATNGWEGEFVPNDSSREGTKTWTDFALEVERFASETEALRHILKHPALDRSGSHLILETNFTYMHRRLAAQWFSGVTLLSLHDGNLDDATANIQAVFGVHRLHANDPSLINQMMRVAIGGLAVSVIWEALQAEGWNDTQLAKIQADLESYETASLVEFALVGERNAHIEFFEILQTNDIRPYFQLQPWPPAPPPTTAFNDFVQQQVVLPMWRGFFGKQDFLFGQKCYTELIERWRRARKGEPWAIVNKTLFPTEQILEATRTNGFVQIKHMMSTLMLPNFSKANTTAIRHEAQRRLAVTAVALKRYELEHNKLPENLEALVPEFLQSVPMDCMDGKPLKYRLRTDGGFTLYSVNEDGVDHGGDPVKDPQKSSWVGDISAGLDIVWPREAATP